MLWFVKRADFVILVATSVLTHFFITSYHGEELRSIDALLCYSDILYALFFFFWKNWDFFSNMVRFKLDTLNYVHLKLF